jgi:hypothetical protein
LAVDACERTFLWAAMRLLNESTSWLFLRSDVVAAQD